MAVSGWSVADSQASQIKRPGTTMTKRAGKKEGMTAWERSGDRRQTVCEESKLTGWAGCDL